MSSILSNTTPNYRRYFLVFAAMVFILLTSCPVKGGIKTLIGLPVKTEQGLAKGNKGFIGNGSEKCSNAATDQIIVSPITFENAGHLLPAIILTAAFLFLLGYTLYKAPAHPLYGNLKISGPLPIFLQYRKLIL